MCTDKIKYIVRGVHPNHPRNPPAGLQMIEFIKYDNWLVELYRDLCLFKGQGGNQAQVPLWYFRLEDTNAIENSVCVGIPESLALESWFLQNTNKGSAIGKAFESKEVLQAIANVVPEVALRASQFDHQSQERSAIDDFTAAPTATPGRVVSRPRL